MNKEPQKTPLPEPLQKELMVILNKLKKEEKGKFRSDQPYTLEITPEGKITYIP